MSENTVPLQKPTVPKQKRSPGNKYFDLDDWTDKHAACGVKQEITKQSFFIIRSFH